MTLEVEDDVAGETKTREKLLFPCYSRHRYLDGIDVFLESEANLFEFGLKVLVKVPRTLLETISMIS
jgi:hypothetical protein